MEMSILPLHLVVPNYKGIRFSNDTTEVMRITQGNVGIGTTTPSTNLDVNGVLRIFQTGGEGGEIKLAYNDTTATNRNWHIDVDNLNNFRIFKNDQAASHGKIINCLRIDTSGTIHIPHNDGIINDGSFNLDLTKKGSIRTGIINMFSANQRIGTVHSSLALFGTNGAGGIGFYTSDLPSGLNAAQQKEKSKMFVYNNGNVVIGDISANTNSP